MEEGKLKVSPVLHISEEIVNQESILYLVIVTLFFPLYSETLKKTKSTQECIPLMESDKVRGWKGPLKDHPVQPHYQNRII